MTTSKRESKRIDTIKIKRMIDESPDTSWLGEFSDTPGDYAIVARGQHEGTFLDDLPCECDHAEDEHGQCDDVKNCACEDEPGKCHVQGCDCTDFDQVGIERGRTFRFFNAGTVETFKASDDPTVDNQAALSQHRKDMRINAEQDYKRMRGLVNGDYCFIGITAEARVLIPAQPQGHSIAQTITSGGLWGIESDSDADYLTGIEKEQTDELREQLHAVGFSKRAISAAMRSVQRDDRY
jgi:hypothetical protein